MKVSKFKIGDWVCYSGPDTRQGRQPPERSSHIGVVIGLEDCEHPSGNLWLITILREDGQKFQDYHYTFKIDIQKTRSNKLELLMPG